MIIGHTLMHGSGLSEVYYSPWFPRRGDAANFIVDVIASYRTEVTVDVQSKNSESTDASLPSFASFGGTSATRYGGSADELLELVRYKITVEDDNPTSASAGFAHLRMLEPSWEVN